MEKIKKWVLFGELELIMVGLILIVIRELQVRG